MSVTLTTPSEPTPVLRRDRSRSPINPWLVGLILGIIVVSSTAVTLVVFASSIRVDVGGTPYSLGMWDAGSSQPATGVFYSKLLIEPTPGLTTGLFGFKLTSTTTGGIAPGMRPTTCTAPSGSSFTTFSAANCGAPSSAWYTVLTFQNGTVASTFDSSGHWSGAALALNATMNVFVVSDANYSQGEDTLSAYGITSIPVVGSVLL